ncbi:MAG: hypothetical protein IH977_07420 [Nitrospinae bacterium]|nr:hypothetical protein [Nitrospinota bacterium]
MAFPLPLYTMQKVVGIICAGTEIPEALAYHRFRNWVKYQWIAGEVTEGTGKGKRRRYVKLAIHQAAIMLQVSEYLEGEVLKWVATQVRFRIREIEATLASPGLRCWLTIRTRKKGREIFSPVLMFFDTSQKDEAEILEFLDNHDRSVLVNVARVLGRLKI